jgi:hypothetical protein
MSWLNKILGGEAGSFFGRRGGVAYHDASEAEILQAETLGTGGGSQAPVEPGMEPGRNAPGTQQRDPKDA